MSLELQIAIQRLLVPGICALVGSFVITYGSTWDHWNEDEPARGGFWQNVWGTLLCGVGLVGSDFLQRDILWKPSEWLEWTAPEPWRWMVWTIPISMLLLAVSKSVFDSPRIYAVIVWPILITLGGLNLAIAIPQGAGWEDKQNVLVPWIVVSILAIAWNVMSLDAIALRGGTRWNPMVVTAQLGCALAMVLQSYGSLGEWVVAGIGISIGTVIVAIVRTSQTQHSSAWQLSPILYSLIILSVSSIAVGSFYQSEALPIWLTGIVIFLPTIVAIIDYPVSRFSCWGRPASAAIVSCAILGTLLYYLFANKPPG